MPVLEADRPRANTARANTDSKNEECNQREDFDSVGQLLAAVIQCKDTTHKDSQNSISPYANTPRLDNVKNRNQKMRIQPHWGTTSVQYPITREMALYSLARTWAVSCILDQT